MHKALLMFWILLPGSVRLIGQTFRQQNLTGLENLSSNAGVAVADYNKDGHLDFYIVSLERYVSDQAVTWSRLFR